MNKTIILLLAGFFTLLVCGQISAGTVAPDLSPKMAQSGSSEKIEIIISLENPMVGVSLKSALARDYKRLADRHRVGMESLKSKASASQAGVLELLHQMEGSGLASNIKSHWIMNAVTARVAVSEIGRIAGRDDVDFVFQMPRITAIEPTDDNAGVVEQGSAINPYIYSNITAVGADSAWALGYDGTGRIVCSFDTGVKGIHPALAKSWKGLDGNWSAAWFDPIDSASVFPDEYENHGTHTMGTMVGYDDSDTSSIKIYGVAPGAKWISAAVINILGASIIDAFEWAADPDGDPNTINDLPDVINHSWGIEGIGCNEYFWQMIDNTEALGIVNIFAAGNFGADGPMTIANPANRAFDSLDCFAVGAVYHLDPALHVTSFSSRGPSDCDSLMIKPNVVAPGSTIVSTVGSDYWGVKNGTSMAAPHVSGAVAILRQYAPDATVDEIKEAILAGCRRLPEESSEPNNDYGWGFINIPRSLEALAPPPEPDLRVYSFDYGSVDPGGTASGYVVVKNFGDPVNNVYGLVTGTTTGLEILTDSLHFGAVLSGDTVLSAIPFQVAVSDTVTSGRMFTSYMNLYGSNGYHCTCRLYILVGQSPAAGFFTHKNDVLHFTLSNFGEYGFAGGTFYPLGYSGFRFADTVLNDLFEGAFMIGNDTEHVSDGARNLIEEPDNDFAVSPGGDLIVSIPGARADQETFSIFNDSRAEHPIGLEIVQRSLFWNDPPDDDYVILEYTVHNTSDTLISNLYAGLFLDWNLFNRSYNGGGTVADHDLGYVYCIGNDFMQVPNKFRGVTVINQEGMSANVLRHNPWFEPYFELDESDKYFDMSSGRFDADTNWYDETQVISTGPFSLMPGQCDTVTFAIVAANDTVSNLVTAAIQAKNKYYQSTDVELVDETVIPDDYRLGQNYPNPFNPTTMISFSLAARADVSLDVYNLLGRKVTSLVDKNLSAGDYRVEWDGTDFNGNLVASGIYFYRMQAGDKVLTRKMILVK